MGKGDKVEKQTAKPDTKTKAIKKEEVKHVKADNGKVPAKKALETAPLLEHFKKNEKYEKW